MSFRLICMASSACQNDTWTTSQHHAVGQQRGGGVVVDLLFRSRRASNRRPFQSSENRTTPTLPPPFCPPPCRGRGGCALLPHPLPSVTVGGIIVGRIKCGGTPGPPFPLPPGPLVSLGRKRSRARFRTRGGGGRVQEGGGQGGQERWSRFFRWESLDTATTRVGKDTLIDHRRRRRLRTPQLAPWYRTVCKSSSS